jgi:hypothetical protein
MFYTSCLSKIQFFTITRIDSGNDLIEFKPAIDYLIYLSAFCKKTNIKTCCGTTIVYANPTFNRNVHDPPLVSGF